MEIIVKLGEKEYYVREKFGKKHYYPVFPENDYEFSGGGYIKEFYESYENKDNVHIDDAAEGYGLTPSWAVTADFLDEDTLPKWAKMRYLYLRDFQTKKLIIAFLKGKDLKKYFLDFSEKAEEYHKNLIEKNKENWGLTNLLLLTNEEEYKGLYNNLVYEMETIVRETMVYQENID